MYTCICIYIYIYMYRERPAAATRSRARAGEVAADLRAKTLESRGFDASRILIFRGGILMSIKNSRWFLRQQILVGTILVGRLGVVSAANRLWTSRKPFAPFVICLWRMDFNMLVADVRGFSTTSDRFRRFWELFLKDFHVGAVILRSVWSSVFYLLKFPSCYCYRFVPSLFKT